MPLIDFQIPLAASALASMNRNRFFVNASVTGSGKTYICCDVMEKRARPTLIVAPKAARTQWRTVAEQMGVSRFVLDVINPEQISKPSGCTWYTRDGLWRLPKDSDVVWDEIHRGASGIKSQATLAVAQLKAFGAGLHAMSATVACDPLHLRALGYWAGMHHFNKPSFYGWCREHGCKDVDVGYGQGAAGISSFMFTKNKAEGAGIMAKIRRDFKDSFICLKAEDIPGFPEEKLCVKLVDLNKRDTAEIQKALEEMSERMRSAGKSKMAELGRERERVEFIMAEALAELAADAAEDGYSAIVFFNFTEPRERFVASLKARGIEDVAQIYGSDSSGRPQSDEDRDRNKDLFQRNLCRVIAVNVKAGGAALSLHDELHERMRVTFIVPSYDPTEVRQALGRGRRVHGTYIVQNFVLAAGTIMEEVAAALSRKLHNLDSLLADDLIP